MASDLTRPADLLAAMPFADGLGIDLTGATAERASGTLSWPSDLCTAGATLHGGVLMTLADTVGAVCAYLNLPQGADTSTVESRTNLFRPVRAGTVEAVVPARARPRRLRRCARADSRATFTRTRLSPTEFRVPPGR
ncbi:uncharacterized protein (TIGR00369 family) [Streptomyces sp. SAI-144]|uniref:PaaI family thioesterase n=1 Tax=Streptomyces sp. SAI-144 TaxID=2940544 RepID=UPI0024753FA9|nr:PaaI family thioesterase [Streptomyces sp. SAI-144]MDH6436711.1 uncharacterized protein (TIGR00369 family) [Streptomyces sp. SAI-144]